MCCWPTGPEAPVHETGGSYRTEGCCEATERHSSRRGPAAATFCPGLTTQIPSVDTQPQTRPSIPPCCKSSCRCIPPGCTRAGKCTCIPGTEGRRRWRRGQGGLLGGIGAAAGACGFGHRIRLLPCTLIQGLPGLSPGFSQTLLQGMSLMSAPPPPPWGSSTSSL